MYPPILVVVRRARRKVGSLYMVNAAVVADAMSHVSDATCPSSWVDDEMAYCWPRMTLVKK